jgi:hypothetical protein
MLDLGLDILVEINARYLNPTNPFGVAFSLSPRVCKGLLFSSGLSNNAELN